MSSRGRIPPERTTLSPRPASGRGLFAAALLGCALAAAAPAPARAQEHAEAHAGEHAPDRWWSLGAQAVPLLTHASPAVRGESRTEAYLTQPALMAHARWWDGRVEFTGMLNLEGLTLRRGELNAGIWGEGYVDRRHPHTYLHEAIATVELLRSSAAAASLSLGKGFAPFGTDDPMARPFVKYPANHHLAQILERLVAVAALRLGPAVLEAGLFNGDEPARPEDVGSMERFGDSWSSRLTLLPLAGVEAQASHARVVSPEFPGGLGLDHRQWSASLRAERPGRDGDREYALVEWARTLEYDDGRRGLDYASWLAEGAVRRRDVEVALRYERTDRPEGERLLDPFRTPHPHADVHLLGVTRWHTVTARAGYALDLPGGLRALPFVEVAHLRARETLPVSFFIPAEFYGSERMWSLSLGTRVELGMAHRRMGRYGVAIPATPLPATHVH